MREKNNIGLMKAEDLQNQERIRIIRLDTKEDVGYVDCFGYFNISSYGKFFDENELYIIRLVCENFRFFYDNIK